MRIVHVGPFKIGTIHGTFNALWTLARSQAKKGHEVTIVRLGKAVTSDQSQIAKGNGVHLVGWPHNARLFWRDEGGRFARLLDDLQPDVVHLEYVRIPKYFVVSRLLRKSGIPFVISLHGGMNSTEMTRKRIRKLAYWYLIERGIHALRELGRHFGFALPASRPRSRTRNFRCFPSATAARSDSSQPASRSRRTEPRSRSRATRWRRRCARSGGRWKLPHFSSKRSPGRRPRTR